MAGSALSILCGTEAAAQTATELPVRVPNSASPLLPSEASKPVRPAPAPVSTDDGLGQNGFYLEADNLVRDDRSNTWTARGQVEARYQGRTLRAEEVIYNVTTGAVTVNGAAQIIEADGSMQSADHAVLDDKMRAGFARGFALHTTDNATFAADVAVRRSETVNELTRAVFTPCPVCAPDGSHVTPTWSIRASKVIQDHQHRLVYYRNAVILVKGVPVFYTPFLSHPDPSSPRSSGFLVPTPSSSSTRGFTYRQPYLLVISPSKELIIEPDVSTRQNPFLNLEWRERFYSGELDARVGYTYSRDFDGKGDQFGADTSRSFILADGKFALNDKWDWGFTLDRASDPLIFQKYAISNVYQNQGLFNGDLQRLVSQIFATRQDSRSYLSISAMDFQGLRTNSAGVTENSQTFPIVAPLIEARYEPDMDVLGGRIRFVGSAVALTTNEAASDPSEPGADSRRATAEADWRRTFTFDNGIRVAPFLDVRADFYNVANATPTDHTDRSIGRGLGTAGVDLSWPFIKQVGATTIVLEPLAQLDISPNVSLDPHIPNEDSVVVTFDETNLFSTDRFSGYDVYEGGQRLNIGGRATVDWGDGLSARVLLGRTLRAAPLNLFTPQSASNALGANAGINIVPGRTGLTQTDSDWVVAADTTPVDGLSFFGRALLDNSGQAQSTEAGVNFARSRMRGYVRYDDDNTQITGRTRNVEGAGEFFVTKHWGFSLMGVRDLQVSDWRLRDVGLLYMDDCIKVEVVYQHEDTQIGRLGKSDSVFVRLKLATLGDEGYRNADFR
ncbi:MAG TPA: LPS assembly protein LptD [Caulobacteraceae bacterium]|jgi:LPS-assembly protein